MVKAFIDQMSSELNSSLSHFVVVLESLDPSVKESNTLTSDDLSVPAESP